MNRRDKLAAAQLLACADWLAADGWLWAVNIADRVVGVWRAGDANQGYTYEVALCWPNWDVL